MNGAREENRLHLEGKIFRYAGCDVIVQKGIRAGDETKLFTEIHNVRCESRKSDEKDNKKRSFLLWSEEDAVINNSLPRFHHRISAINSLVNKNHLQKPFTMKALVRQMLVTQMLVTT